MNPVNIAHIRLKEMLEAIHNNDGPFNNSLKTASDRALNQLHYRDFAALRRAAAHLEMESKCKKHNLVFRGRILTMLGTLNLYLDLLVAYSWQKASMTVMRS